MATLDSPLEALAFEYASFGVFAAVNNIWTWLAVVTAAVSFWRIRVTTTSIGDGDGHGCILLEELTGSKSEQESGYLEPESMTGPVEETVARVKETVTEVWEPLVYDEGVTKGKLTIYYEVDVDGGKCVDGELTDVNYYGGGLGGDCGEWWERWERVMRMRNGDDNWYRYVDLTVINGNVVRLWDDNGIRNGGRCLN
ncbi:unnamed protein product [Arabis nemorensis]|uniref:Uncharacterized protein n=1 Tax=Arabis nemorensis TaxID=586526 RepID=A0A565CT55_9BRAS|nr:unnamed protein product [Arabis nemorensis]